MPVMTYPEPCVSHRGRFPSSKEALLGRSGGEGAKRKHQFCSSAQFSCRNHWSRLSCRNHWGHAEGCRAQGRICCPRGAPQPGWDTRATCLETDKHFWKKNFIRYCFSCYTKFCFLFLPKHFGGFQLLWVFCLILPPAFPFWACWLPSCDLGLCKVLETNASRSCCSLCWPWRLSSGTGTTEFAGVIQSDI